MPLFNTPTIEMDLTELIKGEVTACAYECAVEIDLEDLDAVFLPNQSVPDNHLDDVPSVRLLEPLPEPDDVNW